MIESSPLKLSSLSCRRSASEAATSGSGFSAGPEGLLRPCFPPSILPPDRLCCGFLVCFRETPARQGPPPVTYKGLSCLQTIYLRVSSSAKLSSRASLAQIVVLSFPRARLSPRGLSTSGEKTALGFSRQEVVSAGTAR